MKVLRLSYTDQDGTPREAELGPLDETLTIGRHTSCGLSFADNRLSREHLLIERIGEATFEARDLGSSNGTRVNGAPLFGAERLADGDELDLGDALRLRVAIDDAVAHLDADDAIPPGWKEGAASLAGTRSGAIPSSSLGPPSASGAPVLAGAGRVSAVPVGRSPHAARSFSSSIFWIGPLVAMVLLVTLLGGAYLLGGGLGAGETTRTRTEKPDTSTSTGDDPDEAGSRPGRNSADISRNEAPPSVAPTPGSSSDGSSPAAEQPPQPENATRSKIGDNSAAFLRNAAQNDPRAFLTGEQAKVVADRVSRLSRAPWMADALRSARQNSSAIRDLAKAKNLTPTFLMAAAITKAAGSRVDIGQAARSVADVYHELSIQIGAENSDDTLLMVAAYDQGAAGDTMKMRNMLQSAANQYREAPRTIRSIWFLSKNGKISNEEFDRALTFLAIGTIAQAPRDAGVNVEPVVY